MRLKTFIVIIVFLLGGAAAFLLIRQASRSSETVADSPSNEQNKAQNNSAAPDKTFDACALISHAEVEAVQGEKVKDTKNSSRTKNSLLISQCFYEFPTYSKSVSFEITQSANDAEKDNVREIWKGKFDRQKAADNDREEEEENERERAGKDSDEESSNQPQAVENLGNAAFRVGNRITGALYVLKNNTIIRISIGGTDDEATKTEKLKKLAEKALSRI